MTKALISLIVVRNLAYAIIEWPKFHTLYQALNKICKFSFKKQLKKRFRKEKLLVDQNLGGMIILVS